MMPEKDYIRTLRLIHHNYERDLHLCWDDMGGEYKNAVEAIDKAIEALQDKGYQTPDQCPFAAVIPHFNPHLMRLFGSNVKNAAQALNQSLHSRPQLRNGIIEHDN